MTTSLLRTKLYIPQPRPDLVLRPRLVERPNAGLHCKLTLISAPAGFGKTTLLSERAIIQTEARYLLLPERLCDRETPTVCGRQHQRRVCARVSIGI